MVFWFTFNAIMHCDTRLAGIPASDLHRGDPILVIGPASNLPQDWMWWAVDARGREYLLHRNDFCLLDSPRQVALAAWYVNRYRYYLEQ